MTTKIAFGYYNLKAKEINVSAIPQITTQKDLHWVEKKVIDLLACCYLNKKFWGTITFAINLNDFELSMLCE